MCDSSFMKPTLFNNPVFCPAVGLGQQMLSVSSTSLVFMISTFISMSPLSQHHEVQCTLNSNSITEKKSILKINAKVVCLNHFEKPHPVRHDLFEGAVPPEPVRHGQRAAPDLLVLRHRARDDLSQNTLRYCYCSLLQGLRCLPVALPPVQKLT